MTKKVRTHIFISGRVQGVFFRQETKEKAEELGVFGWVKNLPDGQVEAVFEGEKDKVEQIIKWAQKGPSLAKVNGLDLTWEDFKDEFKKFEIRYN
jgi:acylphosphatase